MTISNPQLVTILALFIAGLFLIQTLFLLVFVDQVNRRVRRAESMLIKVSKQASRGLQSANEYLVQVGRIADTLPVVAREVNKFLDIASEKLYRANEVAAHDIHLGTTYVEEVGRRIEFVLHQFTRQTSKVRKGVRYPAHIVSAIIHGTFTGLKAYSRASRRKQPPTHYSDDEIFI